MGKEGGMHVLHAIVVKPLTMGPREDGGQHT